MRRPRVAVYHLLPPGGALRVADALVERTRDRIDYELFRIDLGRNDPVPNPTPDRPEQRVRRYRSRVPFRSSRIYAWTAVLPEVLRLERRIAADIDAGGFDYAVVHHQRFTQAPSLLGRLRTPTLYFVQEPRRAGFEYDLRPRGLGTGPQERLTRLPVAALDARIRAFDIAQTRAADRILCNSTHSAEYIWRAYGREAEVIRLGVDGSVFFPVEVNTENQVVAVGALDPSKGHELAIEAVAAVARTQRPRLLVVHPRGTDADRARLLDMAHDGDVELTFATGLTDAELAREYSRSQCTLLCGRVEPFGLTMVESLACGTPVVGLHEGGYREVVREGRWGYLVDRRPGNGSAALLAAAIEKVQAGSLPVAAQLRAEVLASHSWGSVVEHYLAAADALLMDWAEDHRA